MLRQAWPFSVLPHALAITCLAAFFPPFAADEAVACGHFTDLSCGFKFIAYIFMEIFTLSLRLRGRSLELRKLGFRLHALSCFILHGKLVQVASYSPDTFVLIWFLPLVSPQFPV